MSRPTRVEFISLCYRLYRCDFDKSTAYLSLSQPQEGHVPPPRQAPTQRQPEAEIQARLAEDAERRLENNRVKVR